MDMVDALFGAGQGDHFGRRIEGHLEPLPVPIGNRLPEFQQTDAERIALVIKQAHGFIGRFHNVTGGRQVRIAHSQVDHIHAFFPGLFFLFIYLDE